MECSVCNNVLFSFSSSYVNLKWFLKTLIKRNYFIIYFSFVLKETNGNIINHCQPYICTIKTGHFLLYSFLQSFRILAILYSSSDICVINLPLYQNIFKIFCDNYRIQPLYSPCKLSVPSYMCLLFFFICLLYPLCSSFTYLTSISFSQNIWIT